MAPRRADTGWQRAPRQWLRLLNALAAAPGARLTPRECVRRLVLYYASDYAPGLAPRQLRLSLEREEGLRHEFFMSLRLVRTQLRVRGLAGASRRLVRTRPGTAALTAVTCRFGPGWGLLQSVMETALYKNTSASSPAACSCWRCGCRI